MGQRHNRRRTRPRSRNRSGLHVNIPRLDLQASDDDLSPTTSPTLAAVHAVPYPPPVVNPAAPFWHIGVADRSIAQYTVGSAISGEKAEEYRLFGGVPGDDPSLCYNMLEYFGHLDYIDT